MTEKKAQNPLVWVLVIVLVVVVAAAAVIFFNRQPQAPPTEDLTDGNVPMLGYAEGTTVTRDENALQDAVDKMAEKLEKGSMMLEYEGDAYSSDGENFTGYLANAAENSYDMYFDMYADSGLKDEIFLSGLVPPGKALESFKLNRRMIAGDHTVYMAFTTVEDDHATIRSQIIVTMNLHVK
jgi:hypothetical protein